MTQDRIDSPTIDVPEYVPVPRHVAIIMDGNGRWAKRRGLPRFVGHRRGVEAVRRVVQACVDRGIGYLTLFAFSSENWRRPAAEVSLLIRLFQIALRRELEDMHRNGVRLRVVGDITRFPANMQALTKHSEQVTASNSQLVLTIAANYGGRWDLLQAMSRVMAAREAGDTTPVTEAELTPFLSMSYAPEPDLFIRTGGEQRISNFLLWQLAYTELYFTDELWPDFDATRLDAALQSYRARERRFGRTSEQVQLAGTPAESARDGTTDSAT